jgi:hypothetical protein
VRSIAADEMTSSAIQLEFWRARVWSYRAQSHEMRRAPVHAAWVRVECAYFVCAYDPVGRASSIVGWIRMAAEPPNHAVGQALTESNCRPTLLLKTGPKQQQEAERPAQSNIDGMNNHTVKFELRSMQIAPAKRDVKLEQFGERFELL